VSVDRHKIPAYANQIEFEYTNWKGRRHTYVVVPEAVAYGPYTGMGYDQREGAECQWVLHGDVVTRDGDSRPEMDTRRRTFVLEAVQNPRSPDA
jgi:hypothetical protein